ncbi:3-oxoacyl-[acyl-carrier-protein] reductase [Paenibacillus sp. FSL K6-2524]|uniref:3-oxoacyl-[acyl-carrier-protein] reductase n=1 Tax=Paenibacillus sp. FSL K6-2524 TaxID=2954516 RepID=UPI0030FC8EDD
MIGGKIALVTGGSRGIGSAVVEKLAAEGATVIFTYHSNRDKAEQLTERLRAQERDVHCLKLDITSREEVLAALEIIYSQYGIPDILVNNAGVNRDKLFVQMSEDDWFEVMNTNLNGVFHITKSVSYKMLLNSKEGSIINMSSVSGMIGSVGQANYCAAKAGLLGFTRSVSKELGRYNIRVNAIAPGYIETDMIGEIPEKHKKEMMGRIPLKRIGSREEVANVVLFLASSMSSYVTGTTIVVDGGLTS